MSLCQRPIVCIEAEILFQLASGTDLGRFHWLDFERATRSDRKVDSLGAARHFGTAFVRLFAVVDARQAASAIIERRCILEVVPIVTAECEIR